MNLIPRKYPSAYGWLAHDWEARTMVGGPVTLETIRWSPGTYGLDLHDWTAGFGWLGWSLWNDIESGISETHPGVFKPSESI